MVIIFQLVYVQRKSIFLCHHEQQYSVPTKNNPHNNNCEIVTIVLAPGEEKNGVV